MYIKVIIFFSFCVSYEQPIFQISLADSIYAGDLLALIEIIEKMTDKMRMDLEQVLFCLLKFFSFDLMPYFNEIKLVFFY